MWLLFVGDAMSVSFIQCPGCNRVSSTESMSAGLGEEWTWQCPSDSVYHERVEVYYVLCVLCSLMVFFQVGLPINGRNRRRGKCRLLYCGNQLCVKASGFRAAGVGDVRVVERMMRLIDALVWKQLGKMANHGGVSIVVCWIRHCTLLGCS